MVIKERTHFQSSKERFARHILSHLKAPEKGWAGNLLIGLFQPILAA